MTCMLRISSWWISKCPCVGSCMGIVHLCPQFLKIPSFPRDLVLATWASSREVCDHCWYVLKLAAKWNCILTVISDLLSFPAFSLSTYATNNGVDQNNLQGNQLSYLYDYLGISSYLSTPTCNRSDDKYTPSTNGWNSSKPLVKYTAFTHTYKLQDKAWGIKQCIFCYIFRLLYWLDLSPAISGQHDQLSNGFYLY